MAESKDSRKWYLLVTSSLSLASSLFIVLIFLSKPHLKTYTFQLICWLCVYEFFLSLEKFIFVVVYFASNYSFNIGDSWLCEFSGALELFFNNGSNIWTVSIIYTIY